MRYFLILTLGLFSIVANAQLDNLIFACTQSETLPASIGKGSLVLHDGILWRGLLQGESSLAMGTPWPVKGYKELIIEAEINPVADTGSFNVIYNNIPGLNFFLDGEAFPVLNSSIAYYTYPRVVSGSAVTSTGDIAIAVLEDLGGDFGNVVFTHIGYGDSGKQNEVYFSKLELRIYPPPAP